MPKLGPKWGFSPFIEFGSYIFLEIAYSDGLQQCLTSSRYKTHNKKFRAPNLGQMGQNLGLKLGFLLFSQV